MTPTTTTPSITMLPRRVEPAAMPLTDNGDGTLPGTDPRTDPRVEDDARAPVRYAVVGLGWISQAAMIPAFRNAPNSRLTALVSGDRRKLEKLGARLAVGHLYTYEDYDRCLESGEVDAVYIGLPNHLHREYAIRAAEAGVHVLCEKPMALTAEDGRAMIEAAEANDVRLMVAYRLHFEEANLEAVRIAAEGRLGQLRYFSAAFNTVVDDPDNIRLQAETGGGPLFDIGIYCINASRYIFGEEPEAVWATAARRDDERFREVPEMVAAALRFPGDRLASFTCSFGAADTDVYRVLGTEGELVVEPAFQLGADYGHRLTVDDETRRTTYPERDQFGPELIHFSDCVREGREPGPSGREGVADVRIIEAMRRSIASGEWTELEPFDTGGRPSPEQGMHCPPVEAPELVGASEP